MHKNIDLDLLRTFDAIQTFGSFSAAGDKLGRTQAAISLQIKKLEELLGKPVLERNSRRIRLTPTGEMLLEYAQKILELNDETFLRLSESEVSGILKLGAPEALTSTHLPHILSLFNRNHPSVILDVTCGLTDDLLKDYEAGRFDVVIFKRDRKSGRSSLILYEEPLVWVAAKGLKIDFKKSLPVILSPHPCVYRKRAIEYLEKLDCSWRTVMTIHSLAGRISAAKAGLGLALIPEDMLDKDLQVIKTAPFKQPPTSLELSLMSTKDRSNKIAQRFAEHVVHYFESL